MHDEVLERIAKSLEGIHITLQELAQKPKDIEGGELLKPAAREYLTLSDLYVLAMAQEGFGKQNATSLWHVLTVNLPEDDESMFIVLVDGDHPLSLEEYMRTGRYYRSLDRTFQRKAKKWWIHRELVWAFKERSEHLSADEIRNYGTKARALLNLWLQT